MTNELNSPIGQIFIGAGTVFKGSIYAPNEAVIHGAVEGNLVALHVVIGTHGVISGSVEADSIEVHGVVAKNVISRKTISAYKTAVIKGDLRYAEIQIERGAKIEGALHQTS
jgi:cytoskeletal protein CcmA (bactofilin family)